MALLGYKERFVEPLQKGTKRGTVRAPRKYPIMPGERLYHYTGLRTVNALKIGESDCENVSPIEIKIYSQTIKVLNRCELVEVPTGKVIQPVNFELFHAGKEALDKFAIGDGFENWDDMKDFWIATHGVNRGGRRVILAPFVGIWIQHSPVEYAKS